MKRAEILEALRDNERLTTWLSYFLFAGMMVCLMINLVRAVQAYEPSWTGSHLIVFSFLLAFEAVYIHKQRRQVSFPDWDWFLFHVAEWVVILLVLRLGLYLTQGLEQFLAELPAYRSDFWNTFFSPQYTFGLLAVIVVWVICVGFVNIMQYLQYDVDLIQIEADAGVRIDRVVTRRHLANLILAVGTGMVILTTVLRFGIHVPAAGQSELRGGVMAVLVYFLLGLGLLSLTQLTILRIRWGRSEFTMQRRLAARWAVYSLVFLALVALISALLPTGYTLGLIALLQLLLSWIVGILLFLYWLLSIPILFIAYLVAMLLGRQNEELRPEPFQMPEVPPPAATDPANIIPLWEVLKSFVFWGLLLALVVVSVAYYLRLRQPHLRELRLRSFPLWLSRWWEMLRMWMGGINRQVRQAVEQGWERMKALPAARRAAIREEFRGIRHLNPRQKVLYYYLALVRRGRERGFTRQPSQTPREYIETLERALGNTPAEDIAAPTLEGETDWQAEVKVLTDDFMEARYSQHDISSARASQARVIWEHLNKLLRKKNSH